MQTRVDEPLIIDIFRVLDTYMNNTPLVSSGRYRCFKSLFYVKWRLTMY